MNNKIIKELGSKVNHRKDVIVVDGQRLSFPDQASIFWIALNKPKSLLTTMHDDMNRETILSLIPRANELRLVPVGGLDRDHTGLMLLTNEIGWIHPLTHPSYSHSSRYEVVITGFPTEAQLEMLRKGVTLEGDRSPCPGCSIAVIDIDTRAKLCLLDVQLDETTPSQLERMMEFIDHPVVSLKRLEFCNVKLKALRRGQWRELSKAEVDALKSSCQKRQASTDRDSNSRPSINTDRDSNSRPSIKTNRDSNSRPSTNTNHDANSRPSINVNRDSNSRPYIKSDHDADSRPSINVNRDANSRPSINVNRDSNSRPYIKSDRDADSRPSTNTNHDSNSRPSINTDRDSKLRPSINADLNFESRPSFFSRVHARLLKNKSTS